jgi:hypothetical protein
LHRPAPKKRKVYVGEKRRKRRPGKGKTAEVKQEEIAVPEEPEYEDPIDHYMDDPVSDFLDPNTSFDYDNGLDDLKPSTSRDYQAYEAASLSRAPTERVDEPSSSEVSNVKFMRLSNLIKFRFFSPSQLRSHALFLLMDIRDCSSKTKSFTCWFIFLIILKLNLFLMINFATIILKN